MKVKGKILMLSKSCRKHDDVEVERDEDVHVDVEALEAAPYLGGMNGLCTGWYHLSSSPHVHRAATNKKQCCVHIAGAQQNARVALLITGGWGDSSGPG